MLSKRYSLLPAFLLGLLSLAGAAHAQSTTCPAGQFLKAFAYPSSGTCGSPSSLAANTKISNYSVQPSDSGSSFNNSGATGAVTFTLPAVLNNNGINNCYHEVTNQTVNLQPQAGDAILIGTLVGTNGVLASSTTVGSSICLQANNQHQWVALNYPNGTWTISGTSIVSSLTFIPLNPANNLSELTNTSTARTNLGLGSIATQNSNAVAITGGNITGLSSLSFGSFSPLFKPGNQTGANVPWYGYLFERSSGLCASNGSLWTSSSMQAMHCESETATAANDVTSAISNNPRFQTFLNMKAQDTAQQSITLGLVALGYNTGVKVQALNIIVGCQDGGLSPTCANSTGEEIDLQGNRPNSAVFSAYEVQLFASLTNAYALRIYNQNISSGSYLTGIDTVGAAFSGSAYRLGNNQFIAFNDTAASTSTGSALSANAALIGLDNSNYLQILNRSGHLTVLGTGALYQLVLNNADHNYVQINPAPNGNSPTITAAGVSDANVNLNLQGKGSGAVITNSIIQFNSATIFATAAGTVGASQLSIGSTTAAASNCGAGSVTACLIINVAGTTRYVPYY